MRAIVYREYGGPEVLQLAELSEPRPAKGQVLIRVEGSSINAADYRLMRANPFLVRLTDEREPAKLLVPKPPKQEPSVPAAPTPASTPATKGPPGNKSMTLSSGRINVAGWNLWSRSSRWPPVFLFEPGLHFGVEL